MTFACGIADETAFLCCFYVLSVRELFAYHFTSLNALNWKYLCYALVDVIGSLASVKTRYAIDTIALGSKKTQIFGKRIP